MLQRIRQLDYMIVFRRLCLFVLAGGLLYFVALVWSGLSAALEAFALLGWRALAAAALVSSSAFLFRFARWQYCLCVFEHRVAWSRSLTIYLAGLSLTTSPGKLGEAMRSVFLLQDGVPAARSLGIFLADRSSDVLAICALIALAGLGSAGGEWLSAGLLGALLSASCVLRYMVLHPSVEKLTRWLELRWSSSLWLHGGDMLKTWALLWAPSRLVVFVCLAMLAYGIQAVVFVGLCSGLGVDIGFARGVSVFCKATLFGAASMIPGGLGAMEASLVWQLAALGVSQSTAVAVAIAVRMVTLWFGIALGLTAFLRLVRVRPFRSVKAVAES